MIAEVIVDVASSELDKIFDYKVLSRDVVRGSRVIVPLGSRKTEGFVINLKNTSDYDYSKLKSIIRVVEEIPALTEECLQMAEFMRNKYHVAMSIILRLFLPGEIRRGKVRSKMVNYAKLESGLDVDAIINSLRGNADNQRGILNLLKGVPQEKTSVINEKFSQSALSALVKKGYVSVFEVRENRSPYKDMTIADSVVDLTKEQENAINSVLNSSKPTLIHGVTGSGKTEVYLRLIEDTIKKGKTAIMLVPEIALTPQMLARLCSRFKNECAILHSGLSAGERFDEWWRLRSGEAKIAIGARSAVFAPIQNVGIIIVDEEHEQSYESETSPRYVTADLCEFRAKFNNSKLVFGSATPKIESYLKATNGEYNLAVMKDRVNGKPLPEIIISDMREEVRRGNPSIFSSALKLELENTLNSGNQAIIFLNRRGYSQKIICRECGYVAKCSHCDVSLTYHKLDGLLKCHYCNQAYKIPQGCPDCGSVNINYSGIGTQRVVDDLKELFPNARILRMDNDTTQNKEGHYKILKEFRDKRADILVGTQMIAKGHDFPLVTLVGILDADMSLYFSDYRASERTFQLITQVSGRSGRADNKGKVVLQTYSPKNTVLSFATKYDYNGFFHYENMIRKASHFPPYSDIVRVMVESSDEKKAIDALKNIFYECKDVYDKYQPSFVYFDKMKSPIKRAKNKYRFQVLARVISNKREIEDCFYNIANKYSKGLVISYVEVNPSNMN